MDPHPSDRGPDVPIDRMLRPFRVFAAHKLAGAGLLLGATVAALLWANSRWESVYADLLQITVTFGIGSLSLSKPLLLWINDGLMGIFFFVVILIKIPGAK